MLAILVEMLASKNLNGHLGWIGQCKHNSNRDKNHNHEGTNKEGTHQDVVAGDFHHQLRIFSPVSDSYLWRI